jgi:hypothetical protein
MLGYRQAVRRVARPVLRQRSSVGKSGVLGSRRERRADLPRRPLAKWVVGCVSIRGETIGVRLYVVACAAGHLSCVVTVPEVFGHRESLELASSRSVPVKETRRYWWYKGYDARLALGIDPSSQLLGSRGKGTITWSLCEPLWFEARWEAARLAFPGQELWKNGRAGGAVSQA